MRGWAALVLAFAACNNAEKLPTSSFSGPAGLALAGSAHERVFVANSGFDAVQVLNLDPQLPNIDMAMAPARFFPLFIPTGPNPTDLAATPNGAYVFVLDTLLGAVRVIDADALTLVPLANAIDGYSVPFAPLDGIFDTMVASPSACSAAGVPGGTCVGRVYLASQALGQIAVVDAITAADATLSLHARGWVPAGGAPAQVAVVATATGDRLFVTDLASSNLHQIDVTTSGVGSLAEPVDLGDLGGPLSVSADGNYLAVGRPALLDVVVYPLTNGALAPTTAAMDLAPVFTPAPLCLDLCSATESACVGAHPADLELCSDGNTLAFASAPALKYSAAYLGSMPSRIAPVATAAVPLQAGCPVAAYQEAMAIATLDGGIYFLGLVDTDGQFAPRVLTQDACVSPTVVRTSSNNPNIYEYLEPCPASTTDRPRAVCALQRDDNRADPNGVITVLPGNLRLQPTTYTATSQQVRLDWEGVIVDGSSAAGVIDPEDNHLFSTPGLDFNSRGVQVGDKLRIAANSVPTKTSDACAAFGCIVERQITAISADGSQLTLDTSLPRTCFADPDALSYAIRAGNTFLVGAVNNGVWQQPPQAQARVAPGASYGAGSPQGGNKYFAFTIQDLPQDASTPACTLYDDTGAVHSTIQSPILQRSKPQDFTITDPYTPALWGRGLDATAPGTNNPAGRVPGGMLMVGAPYTALVVSYTVSNGVYVMRPTQPTNAMLVQNIGYVRILN